jgi:endonuclease G
MTSIDSISKWILMRKIMLKIQNVILVNLMLLANCSFACSELPSELVPKTSLVFSDLCRSEFEIGYSNERRSPIWVGAALTANEIKAVEIRKNRFRADPNLKKSEKAQLSDYSKSGFERGHMFSAGDASTDIGMIESFYLSNMVPQSPNGNKGIWKELESKVRDYAIKKQMIYVFTGPIYSGISKTIGKNKIPVPTELFKVIYDAKTNESLTLILPNRNAPDLNPFISNLQTLKDKTGIEFLIDKKPKELDSLPF